MRSDVFQGTQDSFWDWWWCRQMGTLWLESIFIGDVGQLDWFTLGRDEGSSPTDTRWVTRLLRPNSIGCLKGKLVIALRVGCVVLSADCLCVLVNVVGLGAYDQGGQEADGLCKEYD